MPAGRVIGFEPIANTFKYLSRNVQLNELTNVTLFNIGLSDSERDVEFYYYPSCSGGTSAADILGFADTQRVKCRVRRLDDVRRELGVGADLLKCDVEGAELFVFQGGLECLEQDKPIIFCEMLRKWAAKFGYKPNDIISLLAGLGYQCFEAADGRLRAFPRMEETTVATNFFFLHAGKHAGLRKLLAIESQVDNVSRV